jgi:hypothetical protein
MTIRGIFSLAILGLALTSLAPACLAGDFYAIVDNFGRRPRNAYMDVGVDTRTGVGVNVQFNVYDRDGIQIAEFFIPTSVNGFVSTTSFGNLFDLTGGQLMLIRARTAQDSVLSGATLYIDSLGAPLTIGVLPEAKLDDTPVAAGRLFSIALGNFRSASLLIANVSGTDQAVDVFKGTDGVPGTGIFYNPRIGNNGTWRVDLTQNEALSHLIVQSYGVLIVQVIIDNGKSVQSFMVSPEG